MDPGEHLAFWTMIAISAVLTALNVAASSHKEPPRRPSRTERFRWDDMADTYITLYQQKLGASREEATELWRMLRQVAEGIASKAGYVDRPGRGDTLAKQIQEDPAMQQEAAERMADGVTLDDIRWWYNLSIVEKSLLEADDIVTKHATYTQLREKGVPQEEAEAHILRAYPSFGSSDDPYQIGEDRPLPVELKKRVTDYVLHRGTTEPEALKRDTEVFSSFNAMIRSEIRKQRV